jgi:predicted nuclease of predicted toxin-antitoxin system
VSGKRSALKFLLDEGVTGTTGKALEAAGHTVIPFREALLKGSADPVVCAAAEANNAILVAHDGDMKRLAQRNGVKQSRFRKLSLLKLSCRESQAPNRVALAMSLIEHEWSISDAARDRRIFIDVATDVIRVYR